MQTASSSSLTHEGKQALKALVEDIIERAYGVFLWVRLVVDELIEGLCEGDSMEELKDLLSNVPTELEDLYTRALHRTHPTQQQASTKHRYERYLMFQITTCCREPLTLSDLLEAVLFLTTRRGAYLELQMLSLNQMERRLYNRSAGLLGAPGPKCKVQFIHQTVKEYMIAGKGKGLIHQGFGDKPQESGYRLIMRYIIGLLGLFEHDSSEIGAQNFAIRNFPYYARVVELEGGKCVREHFEKIMLLLTEPQQRGRLTQILDQKFPTDASDNLNNLRGRRHSQLLIFYAFCSLPFSLNQCLLQHEEEMTRAECMYVLEAILYAGDTDNTRSSSPYQACYSVTIQTLLERGIGTNTQHWSAKTGVQMERLLSSSFIIPQATKEKVSQLWAQIRVY